MNRKINVFLYLLMSVFVVISGLCGFFIGGYINLSNEKYKEIDTGKYKAEAKVVVTFASEDAEFSSSEAVVTSATTLADNLSIIFKYSDDIQNLIPSGYEFIIEPVQEANVVSVGVIGEDPTVCATVATDIWSKCPEVVSTYYYGGELRLLGAAPSVPTETIKDIVETNSVSPVLIALIGVLIGVILFVLCVIINEKFIGKIHSAAINNQTTLS